MPIVTQTPSWIRLSNNKLIFEAHGPCTIDCPVDQNLDHGKTGVKACYTAQTNFARQSK